MERFYCIILGLNLSEAYRMVFFSAGMAESRLDCFAHKRSVFC